MRKFLKWFAIVILVLLLIYNLGPAPSKPDFNPAPVTLLSSLSEIDNQIIAEEAAVKNLKPDNEARIVWADTSRKEKTKIAILYLHGFSASQAEGDPVHINLAKKYNANLYLSRLSEHGIDNGDSTMIKLTADSYYSSAEKALSIAKKLGDEVIVIGTSTGGALTLFLASRHPEIKAIILYSPCVRLYDETSVILNKPWGLKIATKVMKGPVSRNISDSPEHANYWSMNYRVEALVALQNLIANTMKSATFKKIKCPVFLAYYYKNEEEQDKTVSVPAMLEMFDELGTPAELKRKIAFPETGAHVIASYIRSKDWESVEKETDRFLIEIVRQ